MSRLFLYFKLLRPMNVAMVILAVVVGGMLCGNADSDLYLSAVSAALVLSAGNVINDVADRDADKVSHPERPIASGKIFSKSALWIAVVLFVVGLFFACAVSFVHFVIAAVAAVILVAYSFCLSKIALVGNIVISLLAGVAVIYGTVFHICEEGIFAAVIAFSIHLPREIFKDIQDIDGDREAERRTLPIVWGVKQASVLAAVLSIIAMVVIEIPYVLGIFSMYYNSVASISFILCGMAAVFGFRGFGRTSQKILKFAIAAGIVALFAEVVLRMML